MNTTAATGPATVTDHPGSPPAPIAAGCRLPGRFA